MLLVIFSFATNLGLVATFVGKIAYIHAYICMFNYTHVWYYYH